jgi:hypothetical protein
MTVYRQSYKLKKKVGEHTRDQAFDLCLYIKENYDVRFYAVQCDIENTVKFDCYPSEWDRIERDSKIKSDYYVRPINQY